MFLRGLVIILAALATTGCVSTSQFDSNFLPVQPETAEDIAAGRLGAIVAHLRLPETCTSLWVNYRNVESGKSTFKSIPMISTDKGFSLTDGGEFPVVIPVRPGHYELTESECVWYGANYRYTQRLDGMRAWFEEFEVKGGEVVYPGTPMVEEVTHEWGVALTPFELFQGRKTRSLDRYGLYSIADNEDAIRKSLQRYNPALESRLVKRFPSAVLDKERVRALIADAYAAETSQIPPDDATALARAEKARTRAQMQLIRYALGEWKSRGVEDAPAAKAVTFDPG